ncbi:GNAT family N-acetyltransferase [Bacillus nitratireducens]|uniref:GNAT family N-acetyltransferase n=1 Tax=Bacillus nitratireducens TaxID=2026193 RepID=UPI000BEE42CE|nr:GNAT family N-acetyltransferase [Bacillus nitratireducens]PEE17409.1 GNAT family N-acetyltransferase [Bacillus cereus]MED0902067.1 GNAT family N-acetyltransferase [Bacillus nitratireducens]PEQ37564.1 GNAT family N-acetyltransferase [Bacillus cereus]PFH84203.1 GNAT family N-acetyltransferase [Bacillus cereus]PFM54043.1 GNAT family N-acetyltransferase [Bacillus cereus]
MVEFQFTKRAYKILEIAAEEAECSKGIIHPVHLFIGACKEGTGVSAELHMYLFHTVGMDFLVKISLLQQYYANEIEYINVGEFKVSNKTIEVLKVAKKRMERFQQIVINEGHVLYAIFQGDTVIDKVISKKMKKDVLQITSEPRDLTVALTRFNPICNSLSCNIRKAISSDFEKLARFVKGEFGERWLKSLDYGFRTYKEELPIFIAEQGGEIIGFACYDVVRGKKGLFGPMGTAKHNRVNGVGKTLLNHCLYNMKKSGYEYAIIGQAGPIEFYERCCNARLIPIGDN